MSFKGGNGTRRGRGGVTRSSHVQQGQSAQRDEGERGGEAEGAEQEHQAPPLKA